MGPIDYLMGKTDVLEIATHVNGDGACCEECRKRSALTEDELAIFDLLTRPEPKLTEEQVTAVKQVSRGLLEKLQELRSANWRQNLQTRATVQSEIRFKLNELPDDPYPQELWEEKVEAVWHFVYHQNTDASSYSRVN